MIGINTQILHDQGSDVRIGVIADLHFIFRSFAVIDGSIGDRYCQAVRCDPEIDTLRDQLIVFPGSRNSGNDIVAARLCRSAAQRQIVVRAVVAVNRLAVLCGCTRSGRL